METIIQDKYGGILLLKAFCFLLLNASWPLYQNAGRNCIAGEGALPLHFGWAACSVVEMALWWRWRGRGWGAGTGWWLLPVRWTVNTGFYSLLETACPAEL